ncbi:DUF4062 domain-containing protein [Dyadobacter sp. 32]|uniref:DUF4062 domain-containing protein n=1 Tax=Dyadobacter sp. 32 TaxID=538966 RepID=UPI0011EF8670
MSIKIMLSSTVLGNESTIETIYATLSNFGYDVFCSHTGTVYTAPGNTTEQACLEAVEDCDFFFGIIFPYYGSGITHLEIKKAVELNKPSGFLAHANVAYTRTLLKDLMFVYTSEFRELLWKQRFEQREHDQIITLILKILMVDLLHCQEKDLLNHFSESELLE